MPDIVWPAGIEAHIGESAQHVALELADAVAEFLNARLLVAERASLAVSGGSTPLPFFHALSLKSLDWGRVDVVLADERWVDETDAVSNTRLVKENLLRNNAAVAKYFPLKQSGNTPHAGVEAVSAGLATLTRPLDVLILGMGNDGHTASLFPDAPELVRAMDLESRELVAAMTPPSQGQSRITLTYALMCEARFTALHLKGNDKLETLKRAFALPEDLLAMPVRGFLNPGLQVFWSP
ncbi:6-phosphogluconolactonase [Marinobacter sp. 2_MG-2023]|uniref:6-phosphogluconolactonase n=1 Tax=Marinobacter sp. 2_MG-2023 TaxID=3062679 RepID=UPI0026E43B12|nr:6-phosphogluconolactonase [Marinobacter sp. 2_MG-2023]MDO6440646.1 6-phosphogluconolactonase [Marinobacter sp. 2_MG-2023]